MHVYIESSVYVIRGKVSILLLPPTNEAVGR